MLKKIRKNSVVRWFRRKPPSSDDDDEKQPENSGVAGLSAKDLHLICQRLAANGVNLVALDLRGFHLTEHDAHALGNALRMNETLCMLNLGDNSRLGDEGAGAILEGLQHHPSLQYLLLDGVGLEDASVWSHHVLGVPTLKWIDLSDNAICRAAPLLEAAALHPTLRGLDLRANHIGDEDAKALCHALDHLTEINLGANRVGAATARTLAQRAGPNHKLNLHNQKRNQRLHNHYKPKEPSNDSITDQPWQVS